MGCCLSVQLEEDGYSAAVLASCWSELECRPPLGLERWGLRSGQGHRPPCQGPFLPAPQAFSILGPRASEELLSLAPCS